ncbi:MAG: FG-GAP repeat protein, partial [Ottowia sp.]|nr:FG-GAP repeat protein [Ottowia sp.]
ASDYFGRSVAISGDSNTAIVGAYGDDDLGSSSGSAYIFTRSGSTWTEQAKLLASDGAADDWFGHSVAISGDGNSIVIGARNHISGTGAVYVFTYDGSNWTENIKLTDSQGTSSNQFGHSTAMTPDGVNALITSIGYDSGKGCFHYFTA